MGKFGQKQWENSESGGIFFGQKLLLFPEFPIAFARIFFCFFPHFPLLLPEFPTAFARIFRFHFFFLGGAPAPPPPASYAYATDSVQSAFYNQWEFPITTIPFKNCNVTACYVVIRLLCRLGIQFEILGCVKVYFLSGGVICSPKDMIVRYPWPVAGYEMTILIGLNDESSWDCCRQSIKNYDNL